jgi:hypothetical protein
MKRTAAGLSQPILALLVQASQKSVDARERGMTVERAIRSIETRSKRGHLQDEELTAAYY